MYKCGYLLIKINNTIFYLFMFLLIGYLFIRDYSVKNENLIPNLNDFLFYVEQKKMIFLKM